MPAYIFSPERMVQKSSEKFRSAALAYGMVKYPFMPHAVPHELRMINRLAA